MSSLPTLNIDDLTSVNLGRGANAAGANGIAIGGAQGTSSGTIVKKAASADGAESIAIGVGARATGARAVQIGEGTNATADTIQFKTTRLPTATQYNALINWLANGLLIDADLAIDGADATQFETGAVAYYTIGGVQYSVAANTGQAFTAAHVIEASKFGVILIQVNAAGTMSSKVPVASQAYTSAALALAALPDPDAGNVALGHIAIANNAAAWTANTDDLTNGSDVTTAAFVDAAVKTLPSATI